MFVLFLVFGVISCAIGAEDPYKLCDWKGRKDDCTGLRSVGSEVKCASDYNISIPDSTHCAMFMSEGKADFAVFNAEELLRAHHFYPNDFAVIGDLRHNKHVKDEFEFQTVAVVSSKYNPKSNASLKNGFCHPGFTQSTTLSDYVLKYFEKQVFGRTKKCRENLRVTENEAENLKNHFGKACRPGQWDMSEDADRELKRKYPELCALCDDPKTCSYASKTENGHFGALDCLTSGRGVVSYVSLRSLRKYFAQDSKKSAQNNSSFLCRDGKIWPVNSTEAPCTWVSQPWKAVIVRRSRAGNLLEDLKLWQTINERMMDWKQSLFKILEHDSHELSLFEKPRFMDRYLGTGREVEPPKSHCGKTIRWCTTSEIETTKCNRIAVEAAFLGIEPRITCNMTSKLERSFIPATRETMLFRCFEDISHDRADIMSIDSNYGFVARQVFQLKSLFYGQTQPDYNSVILAVVRNNPYSGINSLASLKNRKACFPEYGGLALLSFLNTARTLGLVGNVCDYSKLLANFFSSACVPGIKDGMHSKFSPSQEAAIKLCSLCPMSHSEQNYCAADNTNDYYGDKGALECLLNASGEVAFIEAQNVEDIVSKNGNYNQIRVLCKNGSLAVNPGFKIDERCALSVTVDSEVISRKNNSIKETADIKHALLKLEAALHYGNDPIIHWFDTFNDTKNILFKDSIDGLVENHDTFDVTRTYKELFDHLETCSGGSRAFSNFFFLSVILFVAEMLN